MKTIQIPTNSNPFIVNINNNEYQYRAGDAAEVPDEVAEVIEDALELEPKPKSYPSKLAQLTEGSLQEITTEDLEGISKIAGCAFYSNLGLVKVSIPDNIITIEKNAFNWATNIQSVYLPNVPPKLENINAFSNLLCTFYCKSQESLDAYKAATNWSDLTGTHTFVVEA